MSGRRLRIFLPQAVAGLLLAGVLVYLAVPRLVAFMYLGDISASIPDIQADLAALPTVVVNDRRDLAIAARWTPHDPTPYWVEARLDLAASYTLVDPELRRASIEALIAALERLPGQSELWASLATVMHDGEPGLPDRDVVLEMSLRTGRYEPFAAVRRLRLEVVIWDSLAPETRQALPEQIAFLWSLPTMQKEVGRIYLRAPAEVQDLIRASIPQNRGQQERLDHLAEVL